MSGWWGFAVIEMFDNAFSGVPNIGKVALCAWICWLVISIVLHELGHGWMAIRCGDDTPRLLGHMTLDPLKHMGLVSLVMFAVLGLAWGAMPINPNNFRRKHDDALVAVAGPLVNILIAAVCILVVLVCDLLLPLNALPYAQAVLRIGAVMNITLAVLNLIPLPPLDGSRIVASFIRPMHDFVYNPRGAILGMIAFLVLGRFVAPFVIIFAVLFCVGLEQLVAALAGRQLP